MSIAHCTFNIILVNSIRQGNQDRNSKKEDFEFSKTSRQEDKQRRYWNFFRKFVFEEEKSTKTQNICETLVFLLKLVQFHVTVFIYRHTSLQIMMIIMILIMMIMIIMIIIMTMIIIIMMMILSDEQIFGLQSKLHWWVHGRLVEKRPRCQDCCIKGIFVLEIMIIVIILLKIMIKAFIPGACYRSNTQYCPTLLARYLYLYLIFILSDTISNVFIFLSYFYFTFILHDTIDRVILLVFVYFHKKCIFIFSIFLDKLGDGGLVCWHDMWGALTCQSVSTQLELICCCWWCHTWVVITELKKIYLELWCQNHSFCWRYKWTFWQCY